MISAISVKDRLKKQAIEEKKTMQDKIVMYGLERTIICIIQWRLYSCYY